MILHVEKLIRMQSEATLRWHQQQTAPPGDTSLDMLVLDQHRANFDLWHEEDGARDPEADNGRITEIKHAIDRINQLRNDLVERIDTLLLETLGPQIPGAPLHSETPGMIVDRLSILELKVYHTALESQRGTATAAHRTRNATRLGILEEQRKDLAGCLDVLWADVLGGRRRIKLYRQMKMYNDPELNPILYRKRRPPLPPGHLGS